eukprot:COSAG02_NODE_20057_length_850_cov_1.223702_1_plen_210_part_10
MFRQEQTNNIQGAYGQPGGVTALPSVQNQLDMANSGLRGGNSVMQGMGGAMPPQQQGVKSGMGNLFTTNKAARADVGDYTMRQDVLSLDVKRNLETGFGAVLLAVVAAVSIFYFFFADLTILRADVETLFCQDAPCLNGGVCHEADGTFKCQCPRGYIGNTCGAVQVVGHAVSDSALAGCNITITDAAGAPCLSPTCSAGIVTQFDGSFS